MYCFNWEETLAIYSFLLVAGYSDRIQGKKGYISETQLEELAQSALEQINDRKYDMDMKTKGVKTIVKYGVAIQGKM